MGDMADAQIDEMDAAWDDSCPHCGEHNEDGDCLCYDDDGILKKKVKKNEAYRRYWRSRGIPERYLPKVKNGN